MEADVQYKQETKQRAEEQLEYASKVAEQSASEANVAQRRGQTGRARLRPARGAPHGGPLALPA